jgi:hypothetical protein
MPSGYVAGQKHARSVDKDKAIEAAIKRIQDGVEDQKNPSWVRAENSVKKSEIETCPVCGFRSNLGIINC